MRSTTSSHSLLAVFAGSCLVAATACSASSTSTSGPAATADGGTVATSEQDAGARADGSVAPRGDAGVPDDGVDRTSVRFVFTDGATRGQNPADPAEVGFSFILESKDQLADVGVTRFTIWFDGDKPHVFDTPGESAVVTRLFRTTWPCKLRNEADHSQVVIQHSDRGTTSYADNAKPFKPYASGLMHLVIRGVYKDGTEWEAEHALPME